MPGDFVSIDAKELRSLAAQLRKQEPKVYRTMREAMIAEAAPIVEEAKSRASWSTRIPGTIKAQIDGIAGIKIVAGGGRNSPAPHAKAYEHAGKAGTFRHPDWADPRKPRSEWTWSDEDARPFLHPSVMPRLQETAEAVANRLAALFDNLTP